MTDQHPLTDDIIDTLASPQYDDFGGDIGEVNTGFNYDDLRAAADWQLEQLIDWMRHSVHRDWYLEAIGHCGAEMGIDLVIEDLRKAMRPTTTQEDNQ